MGPTPLPTPGPDIVLGAGSLTRDSLKNAVIQNLAPLTPEATFSVYYQSIAPWFPVLSISRLESPLPPTWDNAPLDVALLGLSVILITTTPQSFPEDDNDPSEFKSLYFITKSHLTTAEALGVNSFLSVQSRILVTLFEIGHGFYPAAYISLGATVRAADALQVHPGPAILHRADDKPTQEDKVLTWCGILILDR